MVKQTSSLFSYPSLVLSTRKQSQGLSVRGGRAKGWGIPSGKMKFLWQGSCYDPCLARAGALLGLPSPWVPLDPSFGLGASSLGLRWHLSKRNKSNTNLLFVSLACTPLIGSQVVGGGSGARSLTFSIDFQPRLLSPPTLGSSALSNRWTWGFGGESLGLFL